MTETQQITLKEDTLQVREHIMSHLDTVSKIVGGAKNQKAMHHIHEAFRGAEHLRELVLQADAALAAGDAAQAELRQQRDQAVKELGGIKKALEEVDTDHEELIDFVGELEEYWVESNEEYYDELLYNEIHDLLKEKIGMTYLEVDDFVDILKGEAEISDAQIDLLKAFLQTMRDEGGDS